jgi:hypothetical protein
MYQSPVHISPVHISPVHIPSVMIPPTPGPRTVSNIQKDAKERFAGLVFIEKDEDRSLEEYFSEYDFWEPYSETKSYSKRPYRNAHNGIMKDYVNYLCVMEIKNDPVNDPIDEYDGRPVREEYYVLAKRIPNELTALEPYCTCTKCASSIINPLKYLWCSNCTRCLKAGPGFADPKYIQKAQELKTQKKIIPSYMKYFEEVKYLELGLFGVIVLILGYFLIG